MMADEPTTWTVEVPDACEEIQVMHVLWETLKRLNDPETRMRVLTWLNDRSVRRGDG